jgi:3D (Asp-Asp-Asp) domain-containing protein
MQLTVTFYGFPDNDPPGKDIEFPVIHQQAGGAGTFEDPITAATAQPGNFSPGTRMYIPQLQKYLIVEDSCASCNPDQVDIWMESESGNPAESVDQCEQAWTPPTPLEVEINPPPGRPVDVTPFYDVGSSTCKI